MRCSTAAKPCCCARAEFTRRGSRSTRRTSCSSRRSPTATRSGCGPSIATCLRRGRRQHRDRDRVAGRRESRCRRGGQPARRAGGHCAAAYLDRRIGACRPAGLPAQAPADGVGGAGQPAGRAGTGATDRRNTPAARAGCRCRSTRCGRRRCTTTRHCGISLRACAIQWLEGSGCLRAGAAAMRRLPRCTVCVAGRSRLPVISGSPVPRLRANRGCEPPATSTRMREPARNRCATASSSMRDGAGSRWCRGDIRR